MGDNQSAILIKKGRRVWKAPTRTLSLTSILVLVEFLVNSVGEVNVELGGHAEGVDNDVGEFVFSGVCDFRVR